MQRLYPLKFREIFKEKVWGGNRMKGLLDKNYDPLPNCGESWELSAVEDYVSVVKNGFLQDNDLRELIEIYMGDLVGDKVFDLFGTEFPLLVKFLDTADYLSVQVHPDDAIAKERHGSQGKTEMWYVVDAQPGAEIIVGFSQEVDRQTFLKHLEQNTLRQILNIEKAKAGDVFFLPAGRIHAIGAGITLCEIQQSSDVTYRIYDWDRPGLDGKMRELHLDQALDVMDYKVQPSYKTAYEPRLNGQTSLVKNPYFTTNMLALDKAMEMDYFFLDSFVLYVCLQGGCNIEYPWGNETIKKGETILLPAEIKNVKLIPAGQCKLLETYIH